MAVSRRSFITRLAAGGAGAAVLAACGPGQGSGPGEGAPEIKFGEPVSVTFWHHQTGVNAETLDEMVRKFNSTNGKGITAKPEYQVGYTEIYQKAMASIQAGQPPEMAVAYESMVAEYMKANAVVDLEPYAIKGPLAYSSVSLNDIFPAYIESNRYPQFNNKLLSFPFTKSLAVRYFDEDLFKAAGVQKYGQAGGVMTFDDFKKGLAAVSKKDASGKPTVYGENIAPDASYIDAFIYANGGALLNNDNTKVRFNEPAGVEVLDMWGQLVQAGSAYVAQGRDYQPDFGAQKVAGLHQSSSGLPLHQGLRRGQGHREGEVRVGDRADPPEGHGQAPDGHVRGQHHRLPHHPHQAGRLLGVDQVLHGPRPDGAVGHQDRLHAHP